jgi:hypothetical protein
MSYNVDSVDYIPGTGPLTIHKDVITEEKARSIDGRPECSFIDYEDARDDLSVGGMWSIRYPWWFGEGSGRTTEELERILSRTKGDADLILCWECGDSYTGYRVRDGKVTRHKVIMSLGEKET